MGTSVRLIRPLTSTAAAMVTENSRNSRPMSPVRKSRGMKMATSDSVMEMIVNPTSRAPSRAACTRLLPISRWRTMFSSTTMESSTTKPTASVSAISDMLFRL